MLYGQASPHRFGNPVCSDCGEHIWGEIVGLQWKWGWNLEAPWHLSPQFLRNPWRSELRTSCWQGKSWRTEPPPRPQGSVFWDRILLCSQGWQQTFGPLPIPPEWWGHGHVPYPALYLLFIKQQRDIISLWATWERFVYIVFCYS